MVIVTGVSFLTLRAGPLVPTSLPLFIVAGVTRSLVLAPLWAPAAYLAWCWPLLHGQPWLPKRSLALAIAIFGCSAVLWLVMGPHAQGQFKNTTIVVAVCNSIAGIALLLVASSFRRRPSFKLGLLFHVLMFGWLASYALPYMYMGEAS